MNKFLFILILLTSFSLWSTSSEAQLRGKTNYSIADFDKAPIPQARPITKQKPTLISNVGGARNCNDTLIFEDFQSQQIPSNWINLDLDGNTDANGLAQDWFVVEDLETTTPGDTNYVASASSWFNPFGQANNWLIMDSFTVCDPDISLSWESAPFEGPGFMDGYKVLISTTDTALSSFTDTLAVLAEDITAGSGVAGPGMVHTSFNGTNGVLQEWSESLAAYNGQTIYVAFVHDSNDDSRILLDNIFVGKLPKNDLALTSLDLPQYTQTPIDHLVGFNYSGRIQNIYGPGSTPQLQVSVMQGAMTDFRDSVSIMTLATGEDSLLTLANAHTPSSMIGIYDVMAWVKSDSVDVIPDNDSMMGMFIVTDSIYARDNGSNTGSLSIGATANGILGQLFDLTQTDDLTAVTYYRDNPTLGDSLRVVVYDLAAGTPSTALITSDWMVETDSVAGWRRYQLPNSSALSAGTYLIGLEEAYSTSATIGTETENFTPETAWTFFNGSWSNAEAFNFNIVYQIRAEFGMPVITTVNKVEEQAQQIAVYPNPAHSLLNLKTQETIQSAAIYRLDGKLVRSMQTLTQPTIKVADLNTGMYILEIETESGRYYSRFNKQ